MAGMRFTIRSEADLIKAINKYGFLPFFRNSIEGFSIEEHIAPEHWYYSDSAQWDAGKVRSYRKQAVPMESFLNTRRYTSAVIGFRTLQTIVVTVMISMQGMMKGLQNILTRCCMICLTVMLPLYPKNSNSSEITARAAIKVLIPLSQDCRSNAM